VNLLSLVKDIFKPAADLVDNLHTSEEEKLVAKAGMLQTYVHFVEVAIGLEEKQLQAKADIIMSETKADSWLTRSWRPITMMAFLIMAMSYWYGLTAEDLDPEVVAEAFSMIKIGVGGYIGSRGVEKVVPAAIKAFKTREDV
jgi:hypothetical protein